MKTNYTFRNLRNLIILVALLASNFAFAQSRYDQNLCVIFQTFITKDYTLIKPILSEKFQVSFSLSKTKKDSIVSEFIKELEVPESYRILNSETIGHNERFTAEYQYTNKTALHYFTFDRKGKLLKMEIADSNSNLKLL